MLLRYPGGQTFLAPRIRHALPQRGTEMRDPFFGAGGLLFEVLTRPGRRNDWIATAEPESIRINDKDPAVAAFWTTVIQAPGDLIDRIRTYRPRRQDFYDFKAELLNDPLDDPIEHGFKFLVVNRLSRNGWGLLAGAPMKPFDDRWSPASLITGVRDAHRLLAGRVSRRECTSHDFEAVLDEPGDFWAACDPPFVCQGHRLYRHSFTAAEHQRLASALRRVGKPFLVTYDDEQLVRDLYEPWAKVESTAIWFGEDKKAATGLLIYRHEDADQVRYQKLGPILDLFGA